MKRSPLKTYARLERRTPLRSRPKVFSKGDPGTATAASGAVPVSLEAPKFPKPSVEARKAKGRPPGTPVRESAPVRRRGTTAVVEAVTSASPLTLAFPRPVKKEKAARAPMKRSRMKAKPARRIDRETPREKLYKAWIHTQPCCGDGDLSPLGVRHHCNRRIEQSHERNMTGLGLKSNNLHSVAMCGDFADEWEEHRGFFVNWGKQLRRDWFSARIHEANRRFSAENRDELRAA